MRRQGDRQARGRGAEGRGPIGRDERREAEAAPYLVEAPHRERSRPGDREHDGNAEMEGPERQEHAGGDHQEARESPQTIHGRTTRRIPAAVAIVATGSASSSRALSPRSTSARRRSAARAATSRRAVDS